MACAARMRIRIGDNRDHFTAISLIDLWGLCRGVAGAGGVNTPAALAASAVSARLTWSMLRIGLKELRAGRCGASLAPRRTPGAGCSIRRCATVGVGMLSDAVVTTIVQVRDGAAAVEFYRDRLGLTYRGQNTEKQEMFAVGGGSALALMPAPDATPTGRTELSFEVSDIGAEIRDLQARGVHFADYDLPGLKTVDHVCVLGSEKAAWFQDPDGNVLCLHETLPPRD